MTGLRQSWIVHHFAANAQRRRRAKPRVRVVLVGNGLPRFVQAHGRESGGGRPSSPTASHSGTAAVAGERASGPAPRTVSLHG
jgi:hypothetical protein